jgi:hypothetical protein
MRTCWTDWGQALTSCDEGSLSPRCQKWFNGHGSQQRNQRNTREKKWLGCWIQAWRRSLNSEKLQHFNRRNFLYKQSIFRCFALATESIFMQLR